MSDSIRNSAAQIELEGSRRTIRRVAVIAFLMGFLCAVLVMTLHGCNSSSGRIAPNAGDVLK